VLTSWCRVLFDRPCDSTPRFWAAATSFQVLSRFRFSTSPSFASSCRAGSLLQTNLQTEMARYQPPTGKTVCACKHLFVVFIVSLAFFVAVRPRPAASLVIHLVW